MIRRPPFFFVRSGVKIPNCWYCLCQERVVFLPGFRDHLQHETRDPIEYEIIGYKISLRRDEAREIEVISESEAKAQAAQDNVTEPEASRNSAGTPGLSSREPDCSDAEDLDRPCSTLPPAPTRGSATTAE